MNLKTKQQQEMNIYMHQVRDHLLGTNNTNSVINEQQHVSSVIDPQYHLPPHHHHQHQQHPSYQASHQQAVQQQLLGGQNLLEQQNFNQYQQQLGQLLSNSNMAGVGSVEDSFKRHLPGVPSSLASSSRDPSPAIESGGSSNQGTVNFSLGESALSVENLNQSSILQLQKQLQSLYVEDCGVKPRALSEPVAPEQLSLDRPRQKHVQIFESEEQQQQQVNKNLSNVKRSLIRGKIADEHKQRGGSSTPTDSPRTGRRHVTAHGFPVMLSSDFQPSHHSSTSSLSGNSAVVSQQGSTVTSQQQQQQQQQQIRPVIPIQNTGVMQQQQYMSHPNVMLAYQQPHQQQIQQLNMKMNHAESQQQQYNIASLQQQLHQLKNQPLQQQQQQQQQMSNNMAIAAAAQMQAAASIGGNTAAGTQNTYMYNPSQQHQHQQQQQPTSYLQAALGQNLGISAFQAPVPQLQPVGQFMVAGNSSGNNASGMAGMAQPYTQQHIGNIIASQQNQMLDSSQVPVGFRYHTQLGNLQGGGTLVQGQSQIGGLVPHLPHTSGGGNIM